MNLTGTIHWGTLSQNSGNFLFLKIGNILLDIWKKHTFLQLGT